MKLEQKIQKQMEDDQQYMSIRKSKLMLFEESQPESQKPALQKSGSGHKAAASLEQRASGDQAAKGGQTTPEGKSDRGKLCASVSPPGKKSSSQVAEASQVYREYARQQGLGSEQPAHQKSNQKSSVQQLMELPHPTGHQLSISSESRALPTPVSQRGAVLTPVESIQQSSQELLIQK